MQNFVDALENYWDLVNLSGANQRARYAETLLQEKARTWFSTKNYDLKTLLWVHLKDDLLSSFRPADYSRQAR